MYLEDFLQRRQQFPPLVVSVDRLIGDRVEAILKRISTRLAKKWQQLYSRTCGYIKIWIANTLVQVAH